jgi:S-disulfanyl-L-cysteine oxidoreductase SoxD
VTGFSGFAGLVRRSSARSWSGGGFVCLCAWLIGFGMCVAAQAPAPARYGLGRPATPDEIKARDIDARPDGHGLPPGKGSVREGAPIYAAKCASCHGSKGEGASADRLAGRNSGDSFAYAMDPKLVRTVGSYWPYATTLFDYTSRAMPFPRPGTLTADETYALVAYILFLNDVVKEDAVMDAASLPKVVMPAHDKFVLDNRTGGKTVK